jgi:hypothetical protein
MNKPTFEYQYFKIAFTYISDDILNLTTKESQLYTKQHIWIKYQK